MTTLQKKLMSLAVAMMVAAVALPVQAGVFPQCPTRLTPDSPIVYGSWFADVNGDGVLRAIDGEIPNALTPNQVCVHLTAGDGFTNMADGREQYIFGFANATGFMPDPMMGETWDAVMMAYMETAVFPAPTLTFREGDEVYLSLTNVGMINRPDLFDPHSVHWHGFPNAAAIFDGVPDASIIINMGSTLTYYYKVVEAGTFMYHCHVEATEHMQMGMLGNLYVTPAQDGTSLGGFTRFAYNDGDGSTGYDVDYPIQIAAFDPVFHELHIGVQPLPFADMDDKYPMLNGRGYPDTVNTGALDSELHPRSNAAPMPSLIEATPGQRILLRFSSLSTTSYHTLTVQGIPMQVVGKGSRKLDASQYYLTNSITIGGGQSIDAILDTAGIPEGTYFLYTTNLDHLANEAEDFGGMMTEIRIQGPL